jgi:hypothetical protein
MSKSGTAVNVREIKAAIRKMPSRQKNNLIRWIADMEDQEWDRQIRRDATSGKLKDLLDEVDEDIEADRLHRMP